MTAVQFRRWQTFALRMAHRAFPHYRPENRRRVAGYVKSFFRENFPKCRAGDHTAWCVAATVERIEGWDQTRRLPDDDGTCGFALAHPRPYVCDMMSEFESDLCHPETGRSLRRRLPGRIEEADPSAESWDAYEYRRCELWGGPVSCCLRAGIDLAVAPSAGVLGFTMGDLRRMYRGELPPWIAEDAAWKVPVAAIPDEAGIWL